MNVRSQRRWALVLASIASLMVALDTLVVSTALTTIRLDLGASVAELEWTVNAYNLSLGVLLVTGATLGDRFGRRRMFAAGLGLFVVASMACALAGSAAELIVARAVQGMGAALIMPLAMALVGAAFPPERRGAALGILFGVTGLATVGGPLVGGSIAQGLSWQWIFWLNVPIGLVVIPLALRQMEESLGSATGIDLMGLALVTGAALALVWGLVRANEAGWGSVEVVGALLGGVLLAVAFAVWELRARAPILPTALFRSQRFAAGNAASFFQFAALFGAVFFLAQFLQTGLGYGPFRAGLLLVPWTATLLLIAPLAGAMSDRIGLRPLLVGGLLLNAAGLAWIALIAEPGIAYREMVTPLIIAGCGGSIAIPVAQNAVLGAGPEDAIAKASGANSMLRELGGVFGIAVTVAVYAATGSYASAQAFADGFTWAMGTSAALALLGAISATSLPNPRAGSRRPSFRWSTTPIRSGSDQVARTAEQVKHVDSAERA